jgi:hypothetical protein
MFSHIKLLLDSVYVSSVVKIKWEATDSLISKNDILTEFILNYFQAAGKNFDLPVGVLSKS